MFFISSRPQCIKWVLYRVIFRMYMARFLSLARSKLRICSANHRPGYWSNLPSDWPSTAWAYSEQETENKPCYCVQVIVHYINRLENEATTLHFHGMHQRGTPWMDGTMMSQCPVAPGETFTYRFKADPRGTYWYHSHLGSTFTMGIQGAFIVLPNPNKPDYKPRVRMRQISGQWTCFSTFRLHFHTFVPILHLRLQIFILQIR